ncbi:hypothetical protein [Escherichia albertii]|uniref:hypothetical protein n=1 Tax=Escherichia albertii TaxID=208962 RepID=UPI0007445371|nr:hypothetical protein [Escherichia albertii]
MPVVPTVAGRQVQSHGVSTGGFNAYSGAGISDVLADAAGKYAGVFAEAKQRANVALAQDASLQLSQRASVMMNDPEKGLLNLQGKNAIGKGQEYTAMFDSAAGEIAGTLPDDVARNMFLQHAQQQRIQFTTQAGRHEIGQINAYEEGQFQATLANNAQNAAALHGDNAGYISANQQTFQQIEQFGAARGWSDEQITAKKMEFKEKTAMATAANAIGANYMAVRMQNGEPADNFGSQRVSGSGSAEPCGIWNNNPGNLRTSKNPWDGQTGDDGEFVTFATPEHGIRALGKNLLSYQRQGFVTPRQIISRWAPPEDGNDTEAYIEKVSSALGVSDNEKLNLSNIKTLSTVSKAIMATENNGEVGYSDQQISTGLQAALGATQLPASPDAPKRYTGSAWFDALNTADQAKVMRQLDALDEQSRVKYRSELTGRVKDASAAYTRGVDFPNPPSQQDFIRAYGYNDGLVQHADFERLQQLGSDIGVVKSLPVASQLALLEERKPIPGDGYAAGVSRYESLAQAIQHVNAVRHDDPVRYAQEQNIASPLDIRSPQSLTRGLEQRADMAPDLVVQYQTPLAVFSKEEAVQLTSLLKDAPSGQKVAYLDAMRQSIKDPVVYKAALQQVTSGSPSFAVAGLIMDKPGNVVTERNTFSDNISVTPQDAAQIILEGNPARKGADGAKGIAMPKDSDMRTAFSEYVGDAFAGDTQGAESAYQVALDYYAGKSQRAGDISGSYNDRLFKEAMSVATGGIYDYQGMGKIMLPWGMSPDRFDREISKAWMSQVVDKGVRVDPINYSLQSFGDSRYLVRYGTGYLIDNDGNPVVLDITENKIRDIPK